jgi:hypothetical protein
MPESMKRGILLSRGNQRRSKNRLEAIRREIAGKKPSQAILFRIATNLGSCAIQLNDKETSIREIQFAYGLEPENPKRCQRFTYIPALRPTEEALRLSGKVRAIVPRDSVATANYIQALFALGRESELSELLKSEEWIQMRSKLLLRDWQFAV